MKQLTLNIENVFSFVAKDEIFGYKDIVEKNNHALHDKTGRGNDYLGWAHLPTSISQNHLNEVKSAADKLHKNSEIVVVVGIGGSYLGAKAIIEALSNSFSQFSSDNKPHVTFAGHNLSEDYLYELCEFLSEKEWSVVVISKSGTTTEPAIAFRLLKNELEKKYGKEAKDRIIAITDAKKGALRQLADSQGYKTFIIPDDIGGRYSVLTPVGLVPIAIAGFDIDQLVQGAIDMEKRSCVDTPFEDNLPAIYAATRNALYKNGKTTEMLVNYNPKLHFLAEWWKQLYGESEGKENKGIFPASVDFTTDLHSMGQYIQEGIRNLFETVISISEPDHKVEIPTDDDNLDKLNYIAGKRVDFVNKQAELGTMLAHVDGGVPNIQVTISKINEYYLGLLVYFFEKACGLSGYTLGVNPFDQPGVEAYKKNMFALLEKPGFEEETKKLKAMLGER